MLFESDVVMKKPEGLRRELAVLAESGQEYRLD
jgi:hypothetical protein